MSDTLNKGGFMAKDELQLGSIKYEGIDPLTAGEIIHGEDIKSMAGQRREVVYEQSAQAQAQAYTIPAHKVPNSDRAEQDKIARGRVEKPSKVARSVVK
jgi:hypothetical protein